MRSIRHTRAAVAALTVASVSLGVAGAGVATGGGTGAAGAFASGGVAGAGAAGVAMPAGLAGAVEVAGAGVVADVPSGALLPRAASAWACNCASDWFLRSTARCISLIVFSSAAIFACASFNCWSRAMASSAGTPPLPVPVARETRNLSDPGGAAGVRSATGAPITPPDSRLALPADAGAAPATRSR